MAKGQGRPMALTESAETTAAKPSTEPIERSMPAAAMTKVEAKPRMPMTDVASRMLKAFDRLRKYGEAIDSPTIRTMSTIRLSSRIAPPSPRSVRGRRVAARVVAMCVSTKAPTRKPSPADQISG